MIECGLIGRTSLCVLDLDLIFFLTLQTQDKAQFITVKEVVLAGRAQVTLLGDWAFKYLVDSNVNRSPSIAVLFSVMSCVLQSAVKKQWDLSGFLSSTEPCTSSSVKWLATHC